MPFDTSREALEVQAEAFRRMNFDQRVKIACQLSQAMREVAMERIRRQNPQWRERRVLDELIWELYGVRRGA